MADVDKENETPQIDEVESKTFQARFDRYIEDAVKKGESLEAVEQRLEEKLADTSEEDGPANLRVDLEVDHRSPTFYSTFNDLHNATKLVDVLRESSIETLQEDIALVLKESNMEQAKAEKVEETIKSYITKRTKNFDEFEKKISEISATLLEVLNVSEQEVHHIATESGYEVPTIVQPFENLSDHEILESRTPSLTGRVAASD